MHNSANYKKYLEDMRKIMSSNNSIFYTELGIKEGMRVLDVGCGTGLMTREISRIIGSTGEAIGVDIDRELLQYASNLGSKENISNIRYEFQNSTNLEFEDNVFDIVYSSRLLNRLSNPLRAVNEMVRVTKPDGIVAAIDIDFGTIVRYPEIPEYAQALDQHLKYFISKGVDPFIGRKMYSMFKAANLKNVRVLNFNYELFNEDKPLNDYLTIYSDVINLWIERGLVEKNEGKCIFSEIKNATYKQYFLEYSSLFACIGKK